MKFDAQAGLKEEARHPGGRETEQAAGAGEFVGDFGSGVAFDSAKLRDGVRAHVFFRKFTAEKLRRIWMGWQLFRITVGG